MKKKKIFIGLFAIVIFLGLLWGFFTDKAKYQQMVPNQSSIKKWEASTDSLVQEKMVLNDLQKRNKSLKGIPIKTFVIPGIRGAWSLDYQTKKASFGTNWVPQGLTQSQTHYYISAYDGDHKRNSLIFVVNKHSMKYFKTLILNSKSHVGGIVYDAQFKRLWFSDDKKIGGLSYIQENAVRNYHAKDVQKPITSKHIKLPWASRTSGIAIHDNQLTIVKYGREESDRSVVSIDLNAQTGLPDKFTKQMEVELNEAKSYKEFVNRMIEEKIISSIAPGWDRMQGIAIDKTGLTVFSQSNGNRSSKVMIKMPNDKTGTKFNFYSPEEGTKNFDAPPAIEQVSLNIPRSDEFGMIFESGAKKYREKGLFLYRPTIIDRVIILPISIEED